MKELLKQAKDHFEAQEFAQARDVARSILISHPSHVQALLCVAKSTEALKEYPASYLAYQSLVQVKGDLSAAWKGLGDAAVQLEKWEEAIVAFNTLLAILKSNGKVEKCQDLLLQLAQCTLRTSDSKRYMEAAKYYQELLDPQSGWSLMEHPRESFNVSMLQLWSSFIQVMKQLVASSKEVPVEIMPLVDAELAYLSLASKETWTAESTDLSVVEKIVDDHASHKIQEIVQADECKKKKLCSAVIEQFIKLLEWFPYSRVCFEFVLKGCQDVESELSTTRAQEVRALYLKQHADSSYGRALVGQDLYESNHMEESKSILEKDLTDHPDELTTLYYLAQLYARRGPTCAPKKALEMIDLFRLAARQRFLKYGRSIDSEIFSEDVLSRTTAKAHELSQEFMDARRIYEGVLLDDPLNYTINMDLIDLIINHFPEEVEKAQLVLNAFRCHPKRNVVYDRCEAWLDFVSKRYESARSKLEWIAQSNAAEGMDLFRLARVYWTLGGSFRDDKKYCLTYLLKAAKMDVYLPGLFSLLGEWYYRVENDRTRAEKCFLKALSYDASDAETEAGTLLCHLYDNSHQETMAIELCESVTKTHPQATWPWRNLAHLYNKQKDSKSISCLHKILQLHPEDDLPTWLSLGHVYAFHGKFEAALKVYSRVFEMGDRSPSLLCEMARVEISFGLFEEALVHLRGIECPCQVETANIPLLAVVAKLESDALFLQAKKWFSEGFYGRVGQNLVEAMHVLETCQTALPDSILLAPCFSKLLGDVCSFAFYLSPSDVYPACKDRDAPSSWLALLAKAIQSYEDAALKHSRAGCALAHYDLGLSHWFHALGSLCLKGKSSGVFDEKAMRNFVASSRELSVKCFKAALKQEPKLSCAWNALGVVDDSNPLKQQYALTRAVQLDNNVNAWSNLALLYYEWNRLDLSRACLQVLQIVDPSSPGMWTGLGILEEKASSKQGITWDAMSSSYRCALDLYLHLDALLGYMTAFCRSPLPSTSSSTLASNRVLLPSDVLLMSKKYMERDPYNAWALNAYGIVLQKLNFRQEADEAFTTSLSLLEEYSKQSEVDAAKSSFAMQVVQRNKTINSLHLHHAPTAQSVLQTVSTAMEKNATNFDWVLLSQAYATLGDWKSAASTLQNCQGSPLAFRNIQDTLLCQLLYVNDEVEAVRLKLQEPSEEKIPLCLSMLKKRYVLSTLVQSQDIASALSESLLEADVSDETLTLMEWGEMFRNDFAKAKTYLMRRMESQGDADGCLWARLMFYHQERSLIVPGTDTKTKTKTKTDAWVGNEMLQKRPTMSMSMCRLFTQEHEDGIDSMFAVLMCHLFREEIPSISMALAQAHRNPTSAYAWLIVEVSLLLNAVKKNDTSLAEQCDRVMQQRIMTASLATCTSTPFVPIPTPMQLEQGKRSTLREWAWFECMLQSQKALFLKQRDVALKFVADAAHLNVSSRDQVFTLVQKMRCSAESEGHETKAKAKANALACFAHELGTHTNQFRTIQTLAMLEWGLIYYQTGFFRSAAFLFEQIVDPSALQEVDFGIMQIWMKSLLGMQCPIQSGRLLKMISVAFSHDPQKVASIEGFRIAVQKLRGTK